MSQVQGSFCYNGKDFSIIEEDTIVQIGGNSIILWNVSSGQKDYIPCPRRNGYSCVATSYNNGLIAAAESGLQPSCQIFQMPGKKILADFKMNTTLKCEGLAFSRDGKYLVIIGGLPDFNISIYDIEAKKFLVTEEQKLKFRKDFLSIKFNPRSKNEFAILSKHKVQFYTILPAFQYRDADDEGYNEGESDGGQNNFIDAWRFEIEEFDAMDVPVVEGNDARVEFTSLNWDTHNRIFLCTNQKKLFHVTSKNPHIGKIVDLVSEPLSVVMTPRHILISQADGMINWIKIEHPYENAKPEDAMITIEKDIDKEYNFMEKLPEDTCNPAQFMLYSKSHQNLLLGTTNGFLTLLNVPAEKISEEEVEQEDGEEQKQQTLQNELRVLGRFHTSSVNDVKPLGKTSQMVSCSSDNTVAIWEVTTMAQLAVIDMPVEPISLGVTKEGSVIFIGTSIGTFRCYDVTNRSRPKLIHQLKFYEDDAPISSLLASDDGKLLLISSKISDTIYVMSQEASTGFDILGQIKASGHVVSIGYYQKDGKMGALALLSNNLIECFKLPVKVYENRLEPMPQSATESFVKKVDLGTDIIVCCEFEKNYFVVGDDNVFKGFEQYPSDQIEKIDWKKPAVRPSIEHKDSHSLACTVSNCNKERKVVVTGGKDGMIIVRSTEQQPGRDPFECTMTFSAHAVGVGGIASLSIDPSGNFVYSAAHDGTIMIHSIGGQPFPRNEIPFDNSHERDQLGKIPELEAMPVSELQTVTELLIIVFQKQNEQRKKTFRGEIMRELNGIKDSLRELLEENERVTDIEKLVRDEFVIDTSRKSMLEKQGDDLCTDIRKKCEVTSLTMQLLRERCIASTWEHMEDTMAPMGEDKKPKGKLKACKSIHSDKLIYNYAIRKRSKQEDRIFKHLRMQRQIELRQKLERMEQKLTEVVDEADYCGFENYILNRVSGKPQFLDDDSIAEAARIFEETRARKLKEKADKNNNQSIQMDGDGKLKPILTISKGKLGTKTRKRDPDEEARLAALAKQGQQRDIKGMEEIHWRIVQTKRSIDDIKTALEGNSAFELIYEPYELYKDTRKRAQIEFLKQVVFELKRDFNGEFEHLEKFKNDQLFSISEKNEQIRDLLESLQEPVDLEQFPRHPEEEPEHIFEINEALEIHCERVFTAAQRGEFEEVERKRLEKEALLQGDNMGQRGLKRMLGGNELVFKKEKNKLDEELVREEWMNKPFDELSEDEKQRLKEFEQRVADSKEKQRKQWLVNLQRVRVEIVEIKSKFEEQLMQSYKRRIFYEARIQEQELMIIRLTIALHDVKETETNVVKFREHLIEQEKVLEDKKDFVHICNDKHTEYDQMMKSDKGFADQETRIKSICNAEDLEPRRIQNFVKSGKSQCKVQVPQEEQDQMKSHICLFDPYSEIDLKAVEKLIEEKQKQEVYDFERDRHMFPEIMPQQFEKIAHERHIRIAMKGCEQKNQDRLGHLRDFIYNLENQKKQLVEKFEDTQMRFKKATDRNEKLKFNFEAIVFMKQGQVEVPQLPVATDYKDAILVDKSIVSEQNHEINRRGKTKVEKMEQILTHKTKLKEIKYIVKRKTLEIDDYAARALDVQLYRVTKKTQEIIQGKYQKKDENDKKRLEEQVKQLEQNSTNRLKTYAAQKKKLLQEIKDKKRENSELESKARDLRMEVDQRQQIIDLKSATNKDSASDPRKQIMAIAHQRRMLDVIKQQEEEVMFLKDELDRLRARTFPSFAHIQNKADYPDER